MQKSATVNKQQLQEPIKENITELQNKRNSVTKQTCRYKAVVQDGASVPLEAHAIAGQRTPISPSITTDEVHRWWSHVTFKVLKQKILSGVLNLKLYFTAKFFSFILPPMLMNRKFWLLLNTKTNNQSLRDLT